MEAILAREHHDEEKQALVTMLESSEKKQDPREVGILQYLGFDDWRWALPVSLVVGVPMLIHEVIVIDYKFYVVGVFCLMWHTYDYAVLPMWTDKTAWIGEHLRNFWVDVDNAAAKEIESNIKMTESFLDAQDVMKDIFQSIDNVTVAQATAFNLTNQNNFHRAIQKKLDALASLNEATNAAIRQDMLSTVKSEAIKVVNTDKRVKDAALAQAIATLAGGPQGKRGKDVVGEVYAKAVSDYRAGLADKSHKVHEISKKLEAEIAEIVKAPELPTNVGNVYETNPIL